ncbi:MAG: Crp/Fnr family transcriptional regulator [Alphaproteobacteria bacterium]|nr:Crp/Fnr family transcriptional regulator [Alphaproteobacteria bacterium]
MKMEQFTAFTAEQRARLDALLCERRQDYAPGERILTEDQPVHECHVIVSGLAARYKLLPDGERQIVGFLVPGDLCDAEVFILDKMDHNVGALVPTTCAIISAQTMRGLLREISALAEALWWGTMTDLAVLRERVVDLGRREAHERIGHLIYEMLVRYRIVGASVDGTMPWPLTQEDLADATGLTPVHVNRTLKRLREQGLIAFNRRELKVLDPERLRAVAQFNANYLHLNRTERREAAVAERAGDLVPPS